MTRPHWLLAFALLAGCAAGPPREGLAPGVLWELHGRVAASDGEERRSGAIFWRQEGSGHHLEISGPLGQGSVRVIEDNGAARLELGDDEVYHGRDTASLLAERLGWRLPIAGLRHWAVGEADPALPARVRTGPDGRLAELDQAGWEIRYGRHVEVDGRWLPQRIALTRDAIRVRLVIDEWTLPPPPRAAGR